MRTLRLRSLKPYPNANLPAEYDGMVIPCEVRWSAPEISVLRRPIRGLPSKLAAKFRPIIKGPLSGGNWSANFMPHLNGMLDAAWYPSVRVIGNCKTPQTGNTTMLETQLGYIVLTRPGPALIVYPDRETAAKRSVDAIQPMFRRSSMLSRFLTGDSDDLTRERLRLVNMLVYFGWSGSPMALAGESIKYLFLDETDKYSETVGQESEIIDYVFERVNAYHGEYKIWITSTPNVTTGKIWRYYTQDADAVYDFHVPCPHCGRYERMMFEQVKWPEDIRDPRVMLQRKEAFYECPHCHQSWTEEMRILALRKGKWHDREGGMEIQAHLKAMNPERICFYSPAWISPLVPLYRGASYFLAGLDDKLKLRHFVNSYKAEAWVEAPIEIKEPELAHLRDGRLRNELPSGGVVSCLTAACDTQTDGYWYEVRAWGYGQAMTSWQVREGFCQTDEELLRILLRDEYVDAATGEVYKPVIALIDAMGNRTAHIYRLCQQYLGKIIPIKGEASIRDKPHVWTSLEDSRPIHRTHTGLKLLRVNTRHYKDMLASMLEVLPGEPGAWNFHSETSHDWLKQMTAETRDESGRWVQLSGRPNHAWDCSVYNLAAADLLRVWEIPDPKEVSEQPAQERFRKTCKFRI
jgi:phage terminase large subunit GpA-like protein